MNILFVAAEIAPYVKTGGLGDVVAALPAALRSQGHSVSVAVPFYPGIREGVNGIKRTGIRLAVPLKSAVIHARVWMGKTNRGVRLFAIQCDEFYDRSFPYHNEDGDYFDNAARFIFFSKAVVELARYLEPQPQVLHVNDWQTALVPAFIKQAKLPYKSIFTIHNLAYQGSFFSADFDLTNLPWEYFTPEALEFYDRLNFLKGGLMLADALTTVSPTYAEEIQREQHGCGLHRVLQEQSGKLSGIMNGIDVVQWNPATDPALKANYSIAKMDGKANCRKALLKQAGFDPKSESPIFACVSRLVEAKGFDLVMQILPKLIESGARFILLGSGEKRYESYFRLMAEQHPQSVWATIGFNEKLSHQIISGADFFLMPSEDEPCGLTQLYSMRYGTIPIVHGVGGLEDSVEAWNDAQQSGTGFKFKSHTAEAFWKEIETAMGVRFRKRKWDKLRKNAMVQDFSWESSVRRYEDVYKKMLSLE